MSVFVFKLKNVFTFGFIVFFKVNIFLGVCKIGILGFLPELLVLDFDMLIERVVTAIGLGAAWVTAFKISDDFALEFSFSFFFIHSIGGKASFGTLSFFVGVNFSLKVIFLLLKFFDSCIENYVSNHVLHSFFFFFVQVILSLITLILIVILIRAVALADIPQILQVLLIHVVNLNEVLVFLNVFKQLLGQVEFFSPSLLRKRLRFHHLILIFNFFFVAFCIIFLPLIHS